METTFSAHQLCSWYSGAAVEIVDGLEAHVENGATEDPNLDWASDNSEVSSVLGYVIHRCGTPKLVAFLG